MGLSIQDRTRLIVIVCCLRLHVYHVSNYTVSYGFSSLKSVFRGFQ